jgi:hypothetical protein
MNMAHQDTARIDLRQAGPVREVKGCSAPSWRDETSEADYDGPLDVGEPSVCPFCGGRRLRLARDEPTIGRQALVSVGAFQAASVG